VIHSYYKTNEMHKFLKFIFGAVSKICMTHTYHSVYSIQTTDDGQKTCPKHVEFYSKNKFEKLVHLVGFIIRIRRQCVYISLLLVT